MERLPREVTIDIFSRLPIKYVLRCRCVSKSWESTLSDPSFATAHFDKATTLTPFTNYLISSTSIDEKLNHVYFMDVEDEEDKETFTMTPTDRFYGKEYTENFTVTKPKYLSYPFMSTTCFPDFSMPLFLGSCSGYVCFSMTEFNWGGAPCPTNPTYLFNPITGDNILLPRFTENRLSSCLCGFGLDVSTQKPKVVFVYLYPEADQVQVHTVGSDYSWRRSVVPAVFKDIPKKKLLTGQIITSLPLGFNGSIHWIVLISVEEHKTEGPKRASILSFRLDIEDFGIITMPQPLQIMKPYFYNSMKYALQVCDGCLSIIHSPSSSVVDIWVMTNYNVKESWVKQYSVQLNGMPTAELNPLGFRKKGELLLYLDRKGLVSYDTDNGRYKILKVDGVVWKSFWTVLFPFVGSLISLKSAYGENVAEVVGTSGFGNPLKKRQHTIRFEVVCPLVQKMDKSWMSLPRIDLRYKVGLDAFLDFAFSNSTQDTILCPCKRCVNCYFISQPNYMKNCTSGWLLILSLSSCTRPPLGIIAYLAPGGGNSQVDHDGASDVLPCSPAVRRVVVGYCRDLWRSHMCTVRRDYCYPHYLPDKTVEKAYAHPPPKITKE